MADQLQLRGGTTAENELFTGAQREVVVDTDRHTLVVHDGLTVGGFPVASEEMLSDGTFYYSDNTGGGSAANAYILSGNTNTNTPSAYIGGVQFGFVTANANTGASTANFQGLGVKNIKYPGGADPAPGDISGRVYMIYDAANGWLELQRKATAPFPQIRQIGGSVASNALTVTLSPSVIDFRSATITSGTINTRTTAATLSLVIPSGATLGTVNATISRIAVLALDNAGTVELAAVNINGGINFDETNLISTTAISAAATASNVVYSAVARSNVPYRVLGFVQSTQPTAGAWSVAPSQIQGQGGQNIIQSWPTAVQNTTSGTSIDFTGLPPGIRRLTLLLNSVSTNGTSTVMVQLGSGSVQTTGYTGSAGGPSPVTSTSGHLVFGGNTAATNQIGTITFTVFSGVTWIGAGVVALNNASQTAASGSAVTLTGALDRVRITTVGGTDAFDAGSASILCEF